MKQNIIQKIEKHKRLGNLKNSFFSNELRKLTKHHYVKSYEYKKILLSNKYNLNNLELNKFPYLPTSLFKEISLKSIKDNEIHKILTSSGTSGNSLSKIFLDRINAQNQTMALANIMSSILGSNRLPMLIIDKNPLVKNNSFSASVAGINGFSDDGIGNSRISIGIRGLNPRRSSRVLILEDGVPIQPALYVYPNMYYNPPADRIDQIEVIKGSGTILYGPQTMGGVINYFTKRHYGYLFA